MKIEMSMEEAKECAKVYNEVKKGVKAMDRITDTETPGVDKGVLELFTGCKFANVQVGIKGVTVNVAPEYVKDLSNIYLKYLSATMSHIISLVRAFMDIDEIAYNVLEKWY